MMNSIVVSRARGVMTLLAACALVLAAALPQVMKSKVSIRSATDEQQGVEAARLMVGPDACGECHVAEVGAWKDSAHAVGFAEMHRSDAGKAIAEKLGIRRVKREAACVRCHYAEEADGEETKARWGITCESCHGPAREWMPIHDNYGGKDVTKAAETPEHRSERRQKAIAAGMHRPDDLFALASSCYRCHVIDDAAVVEKGGHALGLDFELLAFSQGEVRHNFMASDGKSNAAAGPERRRILHGLGLLLDLEHSLRALASARAPGVHADGLKARITAARDRVLSLQAAAKTAEFGEAIAALEGLDLVPGGSTLDEVATRLADCARRFAALDGKSLAALDALLPADAKGKARN